MSERLDRFMARANAAYYDQRNPFADFTTSPEISQVFGELLGAWATICWQMLGCPRPVRLIEAGPGRGTLMVDALRTVQRVAPRFREAIELHLIETSPRLRGIQRQRLPDACWHESLDEVPPGPFILLANEFLDALPIRQFIRGPRGWSERYVASDGPIEHSSDARDVPESWRDDPVGAVREVSPAAIEIIRMLGGRCVTHRGVALFIDYGPAESSVGDSLQAILDGEPADPYAQPGSRDLTAHVDFGALADAARAEGATVHGPVPQGIFLARLGLFQRSHALARSLPPEQAATIMAATRRLSEPDQMGRLFKAIAVSSGLQSCPGFEDDASSQGNGT